MIALSKQRHEDNNLSHNSKSKSLRAPRAPRAFSLGKPRIQLQNSNKNGQGSHQGLLPYDNNGWN